MSAQLHRVRLRLGNLPHEVVKRADAPQWWSLHDHDWCIVACGSVRPWGRSSRKPWHDGWYSFITPDGKEHRFNTGKNKSRHAYLLRRARKLPTGEFFNRVLGRQPFQPGAWAHPTPHPKTSVGP